MYSARARAHAWRLPLASTLQFRSPPEFTLFRNAGMWCLRMWCLIIIVM